jgi:hypothetical protein
MVCQMRAGVRLKSMTDSRRFVSRALRYQSTSWRALRTLVTLSFASVIGCHSGATAWTTGEPNAPPDVAAVYRAVLDDIFPFGPNGPTLVVIDQVTEPTPIDNYPTARRERRPDAVIAPFAYRIPIVLLDTASRRDLWEKGRQADSISFTVPRTDLLRSQRSAAPFMQRFPGAWGRVSFGRVGFGPGFDAARVQVWFASIAPAGNSGTEVFRLARSSNGWKVVERTPHQEAIAPAPIPYAMLHAWIDSALFPAPRRTSIRGTVKDSASGRPIRSISVRVRSAPLGRHGEVLRDKWPEPWGTVFTDSVGGFLIPNPPSGSMALEVECPPNRGTRGAMLVPAFFDERSGIDTVLNFRVRYSACAELAPFMAQEEERHRQDVARAKLEAAARAVQGNIRGVVRDVSTERPVARVPIRVDERGGIGFSDSSGKFWLWGFAPGTHKIIVRCPTRRSFLGGKVVTELTIHAPPRMNDTFDIRIDMRSCSDPDVMTAKVHTRGVWSVGFEDGFFTPCEPFTQIPLGAYRDWSHSAYLTFAAEGIDPPGGWPDIKPKDGYEKIFIDVEGDLIGPGSYGPLGIATFQLKITRVLSAKPALTASCFERGLDRNR